MIRAHHPTVVRSYLSRFPLFVILLFVGTSLYAKPTAPDWLNAVTSKPASFAYGKAKAAVLLDESSIDVDRNGVFTTRTRWVVRLLSKDGKENAVARVPYNSGSNRVKSVQAWLIRPSGEVVPYARKTFIDVASYENAQELYGEARRMYVFADDEVEAGSVFAYEAVIEEKSIMSQEIWGFQGSLPVECSALTVNLPEGWRVDAHTFNHEPISPTVTGRSSKWELRQLTAIENEPLSPPQNVGSPWLAVDIRPPADAKTTRVTFSSWADISTYFLPKYDTASAPDAALKAKAEALVAGTTTSWKRIHALCRQAQNVNYISIDLNSAQAGGYVPRPAPQVLRCNYGDCKDKATLLRALLQTQGIESFPVLVYSGDANHVRSEWPAPGQFNHCILAIKVDDTVSVPAQITHPTFGRLVIFDPTNANTPPGWLPDEDCGGRGLILASSGGELITLPTMARENNRTERKITARLNADGSVSGMIDESFHGLASTTVRREYREASQSDYRKLIEKWVYRSLPAAHINKIEPTDHFDQAEFSLITQFDAPAHGKQMRDVLLVFKPVLVSRNNGSSLKKEKRTQPVVIEATSFHEQSRIELPPKYHVDELPAPVELKTSFGSYTARLKIEDKQQLVIERAVEFSDATIPAADYEGVRLFFEKILQAEQAPVVLRKN